MLLPSFQKSTKAAEKLRGLDEQGVFFFTPQSKGHGITLTLKLIYLRRKFVPMYNILKIKQLLNSSGMKEVYFYTALTKYSVEMQ